MPPSPTAAIVYLGRDSAQGERRRVESWTSILEASGYSVEGLPLLRDFRRVAPAPSDVKLLLEGTITPEALLWDHTRLIHTLNVMAPALVIGVTARAWHPVLEKGAWSSLLDLCDRLSVSYAERSDINPWTLHALRCRVLAPAHKRFEDSARKAPTPRVAAGWTDAQWLGARWIPNVTTLRPVSNDEVDHDLCFVGKLEYPPNLQALQILDAAWPLIRTKRPQTTLLVAGAGPAPTVERMAQTNGWTVVTDFPDLVEVERRAPIAVIPLLTASGIQTKVLEAAALGRAVISTPAALAGFAPGFPTLLTGASPDELAAAILRLVDDRTLQLDLSGRAAEVVDREYRPDHWVEILQQLLGATTPVPNRDDNGQVVQFAGTE